ncbi:hypothetical protein WJX81_004040 [Elliptochloris bilobata]|uniref:Potassium transporter n=1 Tax=Elliptochloris bilobata TaxID=381761 RepID=A0AAW1RQY4_9CHLO
MTDAKVTRPAAGRQLSIGAWRADSDLKGALQAQAAKKTGWGPSISLAFAAAGVIFGDIGTSPLYVFSSTFSNSPSNDDVLGATCLIFWSITLIVICKYCLFVLRLDDNGEGGTFALYSLLCRHVGILPGSRQSKVPDPADVLLSAYSSASELGSPDGPKPRRRSVGAHLREGLRRSRVAQSLLLSLVLLMTSLVLGDGVLTPAQSVLGAIYGLQVRTTVSGDVVVGVSIAIIVILFCVQSYGTGRVGPSFSPIVILWFIFNIITAIYNMATYYPAIWKCINPYWGYLYFVNNGASGWMSLSGIFLAVTGTEASYADLGHFSRPAIQIAFCCIAYPSLVITYLGQAAFLMANPDQVGSTFFACIPFGDGFYWTFFVIATAAACVASQAMITGTFSIVRQSIALGCFPRVTVKHTSAGIEGQIYLPEVNYVMMVLTVIVVAIFRTTVVLGNAYGVAVSGMMIGTTVLATLAMFMVWDASIFIAIPFLLIFGFIDGVYFSTNLNKVPSGGWFAVAIAFAVFAVSELWQFGTKRKQAALNANKVTMDSILRDPTIANGGSSTAPSEVQGQVKGTADTSPLSDAQTGQPITRIPGLAIMFNESVFAAPPLLKSLVARWGCLHETVVMVHVRRVAVPVVLLHERMLFSKAGLPGMYRAVLRFGYMDRIDLGPEFVAAVVHEVVQINPSLRPGRLAASDRVSYILSRPILVPRPARTVLGWPRVWLVMGYRLMSRMTRMAWEDWAVPRDAMFEVGMVYEM